MNTWVKKVCVEDAARCRLSKRQTKTLHYHNAAAAAAAAKKVMVDFIRISLSRTNIIIKSCTYWLWRGEDEMVCVCVCVESCWRWERRKYGCWQQWTSIPTERERESYFLGTSVLKVCHYTVSPLSPHHYCIAPLVPASATPCHACKMSKTGPNITVKVWREWEETAFGLEDPGLCRGRRSGTTSTN